MDIKLNTKMDHFIMQPWMKLAQVSIQKDLNKQITQNMVNGLAHACNMYNHCLRGCSVNHICM